MYFPPSLRFFATTAVLVACCSVSKPSCALEPTLAELKVRYLYNFIAFTTWPNLQESKHIHLCTLGQGSVGKSITVLHGKEVHYRTILVNRLEGFADLKTCHLLHVSPPYSTRLPLVYKTLGSLPVLVVTESSKPTDAMINLYADGKNLMFEINPSRTKTAGLAISSKLQQYARRPLQMEE